MTNNDAHTRVKTLNPGYILLQHRFNQSKLESTNQSGFRLLYSHFLQSWRCEKHKLLLFHLDISENQNELAKMGLSHEMFQLSMPVHKPLPNLVALLKQTDLLFLKILRVGQAISLLLRLESLKWLRSAWGLAGMSQVAVGAGCPLGHCRSPCDFCFFRAIF